MSEQLPWFGAPPDKVCPKCGGTQIDWDAQVVTVSDPPGYFWGRGKPVGRTLVRQECLDCKVARQREFWVAEFERGGTDHDEAVAYVDRYFSPATGAIEVRR